MNNQQFRKLMLADSDKSQNGKDKPLSRTEGEAFGSRQRSSIPMTPRSQGSSQIDFARQVAQRNETSRQKSFRTFAPRGVKLASGYTDRTRQPADDEADDREERLKALQLLLKEEKIDRETYDRQRAEIAGGDLGSTHLVKGLDFKLLERVRKGEDLNEDLNDGDDKADETPEDENLDDEFEQLGDHKVEAKARETSENTKRGQLSTVATTAGKKRTRDQILTDLKAAREATKAKQESALGGRFAKIGAQKTPGSRIERDHKGREVLIIVDEDGHEKRKVRKLQSSSDESSTNDGLLMPDKDAKPLGMEVPEKYRKKEEPEEEEDDDIFADIGDDYDPLAGMADSESDSDGDDDDDDDKKMHRESGADDDDDGPESARRLMPPPKIPAPSGPRNYFKDSKSGLLSAETPETLKMSDPAIMAAIKKAASLNSTATRADDEDDDDDDDDDDEELRQARKQKGLEERRKRLLQSASRDDDDLDMGFGTSRFQDEEDEEDTSKVKLSKWGSKDDEEQSKGGQGPRKRGPKKRKGDANNAADVLRVMEQRKK